MNNRQFATAHDRLLEPPEEDLDGEEDELEETVAQRKEDWEAETYRQRREDQE